MSLASALLNLRCFSASASHLTRNRFSCAGELTSPSSRAFCRATSPHQARWLALRFPLSICLSFQLIVMLSGKCKREPGTVKPDCLQRGEQRAAPHQMPRQRHGGAISG